jgi:hypothetical protein
VAEITESSGEDGDDGSGEVGSGAMSEGEAQQQVSKDGEGDELGQHADSIDGEAAEPLAQVVAVGAEDEVFVAEEGHGDADGFGGGGGEDDSEGQVAVGEEASVEEDEAGVERVGEERVPDPDEQVADDFCGGQKLAQAGEGTVRGGGGGEWFSGNLGSRGWGDVHEELDALLEGKPVCGFVDSFGE